MLIILLLGAFVALFLVFLGKVWEDGDPLSDWRQAFLQACAVWGGAVALSSEILSFFEALSREWIAVFWALAFLTIVSVGASRRYMLLAVSRIRSGWRPLQISDPIALVGLAGMTVILLLIALVSPPNNTDSLLYHMPRVAHWIQNASLKHYPTAFEHQLWSSIWAEDAILHLRVLWGSDRLSNLVQWFSLVGSVLGVSATAKLLGASRKAQLTAAVFAFGIPMGILQATSTQNDYVTTFWVVIVAYFTLLANRRPLGRAEYACLLLAVGAGSLTKGTFYAFGFPFLAAYIYKELRRGAVRMAIVRIASLSIAVALFNAGFWARNTISFGGPLGSERWIDSRTNLADLRAAPLASVLLSNLSLHLATPFDPATDMVEDLVLSIDEWLGVDPGGYELVSLWNHEDVAGNPIHLGLMFGSLALLVMNRRRLSADLIALYAAALIAGYLIHAVVIAWQPYGSRFQLPFFVAWGPLIGATLSLASLERASLWLTRFLLLAALPWVLFNRTRPVIGVQPWTATDSIFTITREEILFASWPVWREPFTTAADRIQAAECKDVGLRIDSHDFEYMLWWLFRAPESGVRIETVYPVPQLEKYLDPTFKPCAIICTICGNRIRLNGLPIATSIGSTSVYMGDEFTPDVDR